MVPQSIVPANVAANQSARRSTNLIRKSLDPNADPEVSEIENDNLIVYFHKITEFMSTT